MAQRKNMPGYKKSTNSLGRVYWKKIDDNSDVKSQAMSQPGPSVVEKEGVELEEFNPYDFFDIDIYGDNDIDLSEIEKGKKFYLGDEEWTIKKLYPHDENAHMDIIVESPTGNHFKVQHNRYLSPHVCSVTPHSYYNKNMSVTEEQEFIPLANTPEKMTTFMNSVLEHINKEKESNQRYRQLDKFPSSSIKSFYDEIDENCDEDERKIIDPQEGDTLNVYSIPMSDVNDDDHDISHWENLEMGNGRSYATVESFSVGDDVYFVQTVESSDVGPFTSPSISYKNGGWVLHGGEGVRLFKEVSVGGHVEKYVENGEFEGSDN